MSHCAKCGAPLPAGAEFCPRCGARLAVAPVVATPPVVPSPKSRIWWIVPLTLVVLGGVIWLLLAGLPFGKEERVAAPEPLETIGEGSSTADNRTLQTATVVEVPDTAPPARPIPVPTEPVRTMPVRTTPPPARPAPEPATRDSEISESEAIGTLRSFVTSRDPYGVAADCIGVASRGYRNVGYTLEVVDTCHDSRSLGRWRVDAKTREIFRQREDGRFLRP